jgi:N utilization substance protein B
MGLRHLARQRALQLLYGLEFNRLPFEEGEQEFLGANAQRRKPWGPFAHELARRTYAERRRLDGEIRPLLERWKIERIPLTDRICLRMAICEFEHFPDIPLRATLDEYVELAKLFGGEDSPKYVNGVLNRVAERFPQKDFERNAGASPSESSAQEPSAGDEQTTEPPGAELPSSPTATPGISSTPPVSHS